MKKIFSLGIASAVLAMTAISASAGVVVKTDDAVTNGATITVSFVADADGSAVSFKTNASGLTLVDGVAGTVNGFAAVSDDKTTIAIVCNPGSSYKNGDVLFTQTYTVTAKEGEKISVNVTDLEGATGTTNLSLDVTAATPVTPDSSSSETPSTSDSSSSETPSTSDSSTTSKPDPEKPADTGIALAVFPAIIAGAAVVVAKKRK